MLIRVGSNDGDFNGRKAIHTLRKFNTAMEAMAHLVP